MTHRPVHYRTGVRDFRVNRVSSGLVGSGWGAIFGRRTQSPIRDVRSQRIIARTSWAWLDSIHGDTAKRFSRKRFRSCEVMDFNVNQFRLADRDYAFTSRPSSLSINGR